MKISTAVRTLYHKSMTVSQMKIWGQCTLANYVIGLTGSSISTKYTEQSPSCEANIFSRNSPHIMEPEGSLRFSQILQLIPNLSQDIPVHTRHPVSCMSILISFSHLHLGLPTGVIASYFPPKLSLHLSSLPHVLHVPLISFSLI